MANKLSFKDFWDQVENRLNAFQPDELRKIVMKWASDIPSSERNEFLSRLIPSAVTTNPQKPDESLLPEIEALAMRVEDGAYYEGWGWDDVIQDEREWGDESWADELDDLFNIAHEALLAGSYPLAQKAYSRLFDILDMGEDSGHLPGRLDPEEMLETDLSEARASYLRSVYLASPSSKRPDEVMQATKRFMCNINDDFSFQSVINAYREPLPDLEQFWPKWIDLLKKENGRASSYLLREAVRLSGGIAALAKLAHEEGHRYPLAYVDWIKALEKDGDIQSMLQTAKEGLADIPKDYAIRAEIAEGMERAGELFPDIEVQMIGWREAFYSSPSLSYLLSLLAVAEQRGCQREEMEAAIKRVTLLLKKEIKRQSNSLLENPELRESSTSASLLNQAYLLAGRHNDVLELIHNKEALGWDYENNAKDLAISFLLVVLSKGRPLNAAPNLEQLWKEALRRLDKNTKNTQDLADHFERSMNIVFRSIQLSEDEESSYLRWCIKETGQKIDTIVGQKNRESYGEAANLLVALAEVFANRGQQTTGIDLVERYRQKYNQYSAFQKELKAAKGKSRFNWIN